MTRKAGESSIAIAKTGGTVQIPRLMPHIPDIGPIGVIIEIACLAVACATESTDLDRREPPGVLNRSPSGRFGVRAPGPVARFTVNARLARLHLEVGSEHYRPGRVAAETTQCGFHRIEGSIDQVRVSSVPRRSCERLCRGVVTQAVFGNGFFAGLTDPSCCLSARTERPLGVTTRARVRRLRASQGMRMCGVRL